MNGRPRRFGRVVQNELNRIKTKLLFEVIIVSNDTAEDDFIVVRVIIFFFSISGRVVVTNLKVTQKLD